MGTFDIVLLSGISFLAGVLAGFLCCVFLLIGSVRERKKPEWEEEDPCATCLRWPECNGVDESCRIRR